MTTAKLDILSKIDRVKEVMEEHPETQDNDSKLCIRFWQSEKKSLKETAGIEYLLWHGYLTTASIIERARRKVQQRHPELRGTRYDERQQWIEPQVRKDMVK